MILLAPIWPGSERLLDSAVLIGIALVVGFLVQRLLFLLVGRLEKWIVRAGRGSAHAGQRASTLGQILRNLCTVLVVGAVIIRSLAVLGWDVGPLLAGAGILGVALGFGAQSLVRDVIAGLFILAEDQYGVGDVIEVNGRPATVEMLTVRSTTLRDFNGRVHFVPNGEMKIVVNHSRGWARVAVDVAVPPDQEVERALDVCEKVVRELNDDPAWRSRLLDPIELWGLEGLSGAEAQIRMVVRATVGPGTPETARELRRRIVRDFSDAGLRLGAREVTIQPAPGSPGVPGPEAARPVA